MLGRDADLAESTQREVLRMGVCGRWRGHDLRLDPKAETPRAAR
jgi:hypothetical protein